MDFIDDIITLTSVILYSFLILIVAPSVIVFIYLWVSNSPNFTKERSKIEIEKENEKENKTFEYIKTIEKDYNDGKISIYEVTKLREDYNKLSAYDKRTLDIKYGKKKADSKTNKPQPKKVKSKKELKIKLTEEQKHWLNLVNIRVNALPFDFIERTYTVNSMGEEHASEYINNEFKVPKDKRKEVALSRVEGLSSIRDYIKIKGSKKQKFHYESSLKGALLYASSLGINIDKY